MIGLAVTCFLCWLFFLAVWDFFVAGLVAAGFFYVVVAWVASGFLGMVVADD